MLGWIADPAQERVDDKTSKQSQKRDQDNQRQQRCRPASDFVPGETVSQFESLVERVFSFAVGRQSYAPEFDSSPSA